MTNITTAADFAVWLNHGETPACVYHIGNLALKTSEPGPIRQLANAVWQAASDRQIYLLQRMHPEGFEYLAFKPKEGKVPMRFAPGLEGERQG